MIKLPSGLGCLSYQLFSGSSSETMSPSVKQLAVTSYIRCLSVDLLVDDLV